MYFAKKCPFSDDIIASAFPCRKVQNPGWNVFEFMAHEDELPDFHAGPGVQFLRMGLLKRCTVRGCTTRLGHAPAWSSLIFALSDRTATQVRFTGETPRVVAVACGSAVADRGTCDRG